MPASHAASSRTVRVLTYNVHHGEGMDGLFNLDRLAQIISSSDPDLVAVQEVDDQTARDHGVNQITELGRLTKMHAEFGKAMDYEGGAYGIAVLSRWPFLGVQQTALPSPPDREPRTALTVRVKLGEDGPVVQFTDTHLDQGRAEETRLMQAASLSELDPGDGVPAILAGDMNARYDSETMNTLEKHWNNAFAGQILPTGPDGRPRVRGDYVLFRPADAWKVLESRIIDERIASDHRPVLVVFELTHSH